MYGGKGIGEDSGGEDSGAGGTGGGGSGRVGDEADRVGGREVRVSAAALTAWPRRRGGWRLRAEAKEVGM